MIRKYIYSLISVIIFVIIVIVFDKQINKSNLISHSNKDYSFDLRALLCFLFGVFNALIWYEFNKKFKFFLYVFFGLPLIFITSAIIWIMIIPSTGLTLMITFSLLLLITHSVQLLLVLLKKRN